MIGVRSIRPEELPAWCRCLEEEPARELALQIMELWEEELGRPEWTLGFEDAGQWVARLLLWHEEHSPDVLQIDRAALPWNGAWKRPLDELLHAATRIAREAGAAALAWEVSPEHPALPLLAAKGFVDTGLHCEWQVACSTCSDPLPKGSREEALLEKLDPVVRELWLEDIALRAAGENCLLLALPDGEEEAELRLIGDPEAARALGGFAGQLHRRGVRRLRTEAEGTRFPEWFRALGEGRPRRVRQWRELLLPLE